MPGTSKTETETCDGTCDKDPLPTEDMVTVPTTGNRPTRFLCPDCYNRHIDNGDTIEQ